MRKRGAIEILEQAVNLLRTAPASAVAAYLTGAVPFTIAFLFFLVDMTHSPFAFEHLGVASFAVALLYVWKCTWQAVFTASLYRSLSPGPEPSGSWWRLASIQSAMQPVGLILMLPLPWLVAFFRNLALFAGLGARHPIRTATRQATLWTRQNSCILLLVSLAGLLLFVNLLILLIALPQLARSFLGIEGDLARLGLRILNVTTLSVAAALTWLTIDPLLDAVYVLRCFYGESLSSGEDLRAALRKAAMTAGLAAAILSTVICAVIYVVPSAHAQEPAPTPAASVDSGRLDSSIQEVVHRREFTWRAPLPEGDQPEGRWVSWYRSIERNAAYLWDWLVKKFEDWMRGQSTTDPNGKGAAVTRRQLQILIAIVAVLIAAGALFYFQRKRAPVVAAQAVAEATPTVDLADESVTADQLPEDSWWKLAEELRSKGEHRLALRALYLAGLNHLAGRGLVSVRRWKTGLDYRRELDRRARALPGMTPVFARNVARFEQGWYGHDAVDQAAVESLIAGIQELRASGKA